MLFKMIIVRPLHWARRTASAILNTALCQSIIQITTEPGETFCQERATIVDIADNYDKSADAWILLGSQFSDKTIRAINKRRRTPSRIVDGKLLLTELKRIKNGDKYRIQKLLAYKLMRLANVQSRSKVNNVVNDLEAFANLLQVRITVYDQQTKA